MASTRWWARISATGAAAALAAGGAPAPDSAARAPLSPQPMSQVLGAVWQDATRTDLLARIDPVSLRPADARRVPLRSAGGWAFAPDRATIAFASHESNVASNFPRAWVRLVDPNRMRRVADIALGRGWAVALAWLTPDRIIVLQQTLANENVAVFVNPLEQRIVGRRQLDGWLLEARRTARELVALVAPNEGIAPARLLRFGSDGEVQTVALERIVGGAEPIAGGADAHAVRHRKPALAVDAAGRKAYVVADTGLVAEIPLDTRTVSYRMPVERRSWFGRLREWVEPTAQAKTVEGSIRYARWLGDGLLATCGTDHSLVRTSAGEQRPRTDPAGLRVIDVRNWTSRTLDSSAMYVTVADGLLFATGFRPDWIEESKGIGVTAYEPDGDVVLRLFEGKVVTVAEVAAGRGYFWVGGLQRVTVVDLSSGRALATRARLPRLVRELSWLDG